jgi:hypothetical protein
MPAIETLALSYFVIIANIVATTSGTWIRFLRKTCYVGVCFPYIMTYEAFALSFLVVIADIFTSTVRTWIRCFRF